MAPDAHSKHVAAHLLAGAERHSATAATFFGELIVDAIDEVLGLYRLPRQLSELRGAAAATVGSVIEQRVMSLLSLEPGTARDARALGRDLELKWSLRQRYEIGSNQVGCHCLFLGAVEDRFQVGVFRADLARAGVQLLGELNGDKKRSFSPRLVRGSGADRGKAVAWLVRDEPLPWDRCRRFVQAPPIGL